MEVMEPGREPGERLVITDGMLAWRAVALGALPLIVGEGAFGLRLRTISFDGRAN
jgi:hypothetical protein